MDTETQSPPVGSRWLAYAEQAANELREAELQVADKRKKLDAVLAVASGYISVTDLATVTGLSRETVYKSIARSIGTERPG